MNFTREPIIETIITPREGYKLIVRNSKGGAKEEYMVDAIEVVSFGHSFFFRSMERPKSFLVPVSDYEVVEVKETRIALKSVNIERAIKIGGGREAKPQAKEVEPIIEEAVAKEQVKEKPLAEKKRERRRHRRRRMEEKIKEEQSTPPPIEAGEERPRKKDDETQVSSSIVTRLIPPPPGLINEKFFKSKKEKHPIEETERIIPSETLSKSTIEKTSSQPEDIILKPLEKLEEEETFPPDTTESGDMQRVNAETVEISSQTSFSSTPPWSFTPFGKIW